MIAVDTNVIAYLILDDDPRAVTLLERDREWVAPLLWRSELRNVLATCVEAERFDLEKAFSFMELAEDLMRGGEYRVPSGPVLRLAAESGLSAYDCEFVALAQELGVSLFTSDRAVVRAFPGVAAALSSAPRNASP